MAQEFVWTILYNPFLSSSYSSTPHGSWMVAGLKMDVTARKDYPLNGLPFYELMVVSLIYFGSTMEAFNSLRKIPFSFNNLIISTPSSMLYQFLTLTCGYRRKNHYYMSSKPCPVPTYVTPIFTPLLSSTTGILHVISQ